VGLPYPEFGPLWARLRGEGHLWHRTSLAAVDAILRDGEIVPNLGQFPNTFGQSSVSYGRHLRAVSIFDFDTENEADALTHVCDFPLVGVLICIRRAALDRTKLLLPSQIARGEHPIDTLPDRIKGARMFVPAVEALYLGPIPTSAFGGYILAGDGSRWHELEANEDVVPALSAIHAEWIADGERLAAARHARGDFTLDEIVRASYDTAAAQPSQHGNDQCGT